jgi:ADP-ribose diphosphatase
MNKSQPPKILARALAAKSERFQIERMDLQFSNGEQRVYERLLNGRHGAVLVVAIEGEDLLLIREYCAGTEDYQLAFCKGKVDAGEQPDEAANRELKEEVGFGARQMSLLKTATLAPGYMTHVTHLFLAQDLYVECLEGDEPEPLEVVRWPLAKWRDLLNEPSFTEGRSIAALFLAMQVVGRLG